MFDYAGYPWKTQEMIRKILTTQYGANEEGLCGDEDTGQMSAWYVFSSMGFYPVAPGSTEYAIGAPQFGNVEMLLDNGEKLVIQANNLTEENKYIQSVKLNGTPLNTCFLQHNDLIKGASIVFEMGNKPSQWGK